MPASRARVGCRCRKSPGLLIDVVVRSALAAAGLVAEVLLERGQRITSPEFLKKC